MLVARIGKGVIVAAALSVFGGCQSVGPVAIDAGRDRYNSVLQETSKQQAFENIIRVHNNESTSFMDVTEVDATQTFTGTVSGSVTGIGAKAGTSGGTLAGQVGSVTPGVSYSESPIIRYVPLVGQGLVEQTVAPVNTDALASLYDSGWDVMPLLDLSTSFLTLDHDEYGAALNMIAELDSYNRLQLTSTKSDWTKNQNASGNGSNGTSNPQANNAQSKKTPTASSTDDALVIYLLPYHPHSHESSPDEQREKALWNQLAALYRGTQVAVGGSAQQQIELRTMPVTKTPKRFTYTAPLMRTYSALGILRNAAKGPDPRIAFVFPDEYYKITQYPWNDPDHKDSSLCAYTVAPEDVKPGDEEFSHTASAANEDQRDDHWADKELGRWLKEKYDEQQASNGRLSLPYVYWRPGISEDKLVKANQRLWKLRRYMLIIRSDAPPPADAYVAYFDRGLWYYIAGNDTISQKNFNLISLFLTVMAIPPTNPPLSTSISIGGGG